MPSISQIIESGGRRWEVLTDPATGRECVRLLDDRPDGRQGEDSTATGRFYRWTLTDSDPGDFNPDHLLAECNRLTGNPLSRNDRELAELIGSTFRFSSLACVQLMGDMSRRSRTRIGSLAYFRAGIRDISQQCQIAGEHAAAANGQKRGAELKAVRAVVEEWRKR